MAYPNIFEAFLLVTLSLLFDSTWNSVNCETIPITKCCASDESYVIGFDFCKPANESLNRSYPPIYSSDVETAVAGDASRIQLTYHMPTCPDGFVHSAVSTNFFLFENGSLSIPELGISRPHGEFCVDEFESLDLSLSEPVLKWAARFCVPDPCLGSSNCVRKCCPQGMILYFSSDGREFHCRHSENIKFDYSTLYNSSETDDDSRLFIETGSDESYVIHSGAAPKCENNEFDKILEQKGNETAESFFVIRNGSAFIEGYKQVPNEYCIDSVQSDNEDQTSNLLMGIVCFPPEVEPGLLDSAYPYILFVSSLFLFATFVVYSLVPEMRNVHGLCVMCQVAATTVTYTCLGAMQLMDSFTVRGPHCIIIAILLHFSFLSIFSWLNVISFYTWWILRHLQPNARSRDRNATKQFLYCSIYGWGLPFIFVFIGQILDGSYDRKYHEVLDIPLISDDGIIRPDFGVERCWFPSNNKTSLIVYLYGPIGVLIGANFILFFLTIIALCEATRDTVVARRNQAKQKFRVIFSLFILMGLFWLMEVISFFANGSHDIWIVTDIVNMLTGVIIFIMFICKRTVWNRLKKRYPCLERLDGAICHNGPSWIAKLFGSSGNNENSTGSSSDAPANMPRIQETVTTPAVGAPQLKDYFDVRVNMTETN